jgi:hypothetical protein
MLRVEGRIDVMMISRKDATEIRKDVRVLQVTSISPTIVV